MSCFQELRGRGRRLIVRVATLAMGASLAGCSSSAPPERATVDPRALFQQACAKCHGEDGTGGLPMAANGPRPMDLTTVEWQRSRTQAEVAAAIRDGRGAMPPFHDVLTAEQIEALSTYIRTLKRP
jgi:mono/diheme cytochrome c family protein